MSYVDLNFPANDDEGGDRLFSTHIPHVAGYKTLEGVGDSPSLVAGASIPSKKEI